jgi:RNA polymerase sigma-70 factor (ECF subfamily)
MRGAMAYESQDAESQDDALRSIDPQDVESESAGPTAEFLELYSHNYPRLQYYLMTLLPTADDAADVLQETSLVLWRKFAAYETGTNFFAWACKIARLQAMKHRERRGKSVVGFDAQLMDLLAVEAADDQLAPNGLLPDLRVCLERLSPRDRQLIQKRYEPDTTVGHLAAEIGRTANSLSKTLGRIRRALLLCIERRQAAERNQQLAPAPARTPNLDLGGHGSQLKLRPS